MNTLIIDTSQSNILVILLANGQVYRVPHIECNLNHSVIINNTVNQVLTEADIPLKNVDVIAVVIGCGSFTGIRVGIAFAKGVRLVNNCKFLAVNSLEIAAYTNNSQVITSYIPANKGYYTATYKGEIQLSPPYYTTILEKTSNTIEVSNCINYADNLITIVANRIAAQAFDEELKPSYIQLCQADKDLQALIRYPIYNLTLADLDDLVELEQNCFRVEAWSKNILTQTLTEPNTHIWGIKLSGKLIAYCCIGIILDEASLYNISVDERYRNRGISKLLMNHMEQFAINNGVIKIHLEVNANNLSAINLYKKYGYKQIGTRHNYYSGQLYACRDACTMLKTLSTE